MATLRKSQPDPEAIYEPVQSYAIGNRVYRADIRLRGDHEEVRARFGRWMNATLPDDIKSRFRAEALWGEINAEGPTAAPAPDPVASPPSGRMRALRSFRLADPDLQHVARINVGQLVDASDAVYRRYPHEFTKDVEDR